MNNKKSILIVSLLLGVSIINYFYKNNTFYMQNKVLEIKREFIIKDLPIKEKEVDERIQDIKKQTNSGNRIGYISIPKLDILLSIYDKEKDLRKGAVTTGQWDLIKKEKVQPTFGEGNFSLSAHNFNDGVHFFSPLQQHTNSNKPYLVKGKTQENDWLVGEKMYITDGEKIYVYAISKQYLVKKKNIAPIQTMKEHVVTLISCLYPNDEYRIITPCFLETVVYLEEAPLEYVSYFDLSIKKENTK